MKDFILSEIKRLAAQSGGTPPGVAAFANATGITQGKWRGVIWARWADALAEAGFTANQMVSRRDSSEILEKVVALTKGLGRIPSNSDMRLHGRTDKTFPNDKTVAKHFGGMPGLMAALRKRAIQEGDNFLLDLLPDEAPSAFTKDERRADGTVYLLKSGGFFRIGRSDQIENRIKQIAVALPEASNLVHAIRTDDPPGIEAYWHRRFSDRRANGEWFKLSPQDVRAFTRRTFQ